MNIICEIATAIIDHFMEDPLGSLASAIVIW